MKKWIFTFLAMTVVGLILWSCSDDGSTNPSNKAPTCTINSPIDGSSFKIGNSIPVIVSASDEDGSIDNVKIYANTNLIDSLTGDVYLTNIDTNDYELGDLLITAIAVDNEGKETSSQITVQITTENSITIIVPNGGESWSVGTSKLIQWQSSLPEPVKIELFKNNIYQTSIISSTLNDGEYSWAIPTDLEVSNDYKINISGVNSSNINDQSNNNFSLIAHSNDPYITLISPNGSENFLSDNQIEIKWDSNFADDVSLELYKNGAIYKTINSQVQNSGSYTWDIPVDIIHSRDYKIKITRKVDELVLDYSDSEFNILDLMIIDPNGGDILVLNNYSTSLGSTQVE
ncbi:MAG: hypothetical protein JXR48_09160 [Candidatus Delongbacteria bacterium]|nr:hypothetical protein [Candidatus Delongbacteria bacterium]